MINREGPGRATERLAVTRLWRSIYSIKTNRYRSAGPFITGVGQKWATVSGTLSGALGKIEWPAECCLCQEPDEDGAICGACRMLLPRNPEACPTCAYPLIADEKGAIGAAAEEGECAECRLLLPSFEAAAVPFLYRFPVDQLVFQLKYHDATGVARAIAQLMSNSVCVASMLNGQHTDVLVPIPLEPARYQQRGFNQAGQIAAWLSRFTGYPMQSSLLLRAYGDHSAPSQTGRGRQSRLDAFRPNSRVAGETVFQANNVEGLSVVLVDDVMTTGATFNAATDALLDAGAASVRVCAFARTTH